MLFRSGRQVETRSIEIFRVNEDGLIVSVRSFFDQPTDFALSSYFTPQSSPGSHSD